MSTINRYTVIDADGVETPQLDTYAEATEHVRKFGGQQIIEYEYEFSDSSVVWEAADAEPDDDDYESEDDSDMDDDEAQAFLVDLIDCVPDAGGDA